MKKALLYIVFSINILFAQEIRDLIRPVNLVSGRTDSVMVSDLFYSPDYKIKFRPSDNLEFSYSPSHKMLYLAAKRGFEGIGLINFVLNKKEYVIPFKSEVLREVTFRYIPMESFKTVNLFGSFNSWNREELKMEDKNNDGIYEISIPLQPGRYEYKFYVDGKELVDRANPEKVPNGLGDYNSVIDVKPLHTEKAYLHLIKKEGNNITFYYDRENQKDTLKLKDIIVLLNNSLFPKEKITLSGNYFTVRLQPKDFRENNILRAVVQQEGFATNIQSVFLDPAIQSGVKQNNTPYDKIIYSLMIDRFKDGDTSNSKPIDNPNLMKPANYNGGDLQGILDKINDGYFESLGINTLWITPIIDNTDKAFKEYPPPHRYYSGYHGYWPVSATKVEEHFGTMNLFKDLVSTAHKKGIKILLDYVAHHVHIDHPFWNEHRDWFGKLELPGGKLNLRLWDEQRLTTWFEPYMPSFDYTRSKEALETMTDNAVWWLKETGIDGFRHDAVKHVPNSFWRRLTQKININIEKNGKEIYQIGETFGGYGLISSYVNNGQLDAQFNFNLYDTAIPVFLSDNSSFKVLDAEMNKTFNVYGVNHLMGNIMDSHDKVRFMAYADKDIELGGKNAGEIAWTNPPEVNNLDSYKWLKLYEAYLLSIPGIPVIYYGDEFGMTGAADPDNRRMMRFGNQLSDPEKQTLDEISKIISVRDEHPALRYGDYQTLYVDDNVYVYLRSDVNERVLVALNKSWRLQKITLNLPPVYGLTKSVDLINGDGGEIKDNSFRINVSPVNYMILKLD